MSQQPFYYIVETTIPLERSALFEEIKELAFEAGASGMEEYSMDEESVDRLLGEEAFCGGEIPESIWEKLESNQQNHDLRIKFYFEEEFPQTFFEQLKNEYSFQSQWEKCEREDWNTSWRENFSRIEVGDSLEVIPSWEKEEKSGSDKTQLYIYPGQGFGTGNHETTHLCLEMFQKIHKNHQISFEHSLLDYGCGSGILGLHALKLGYSSVHFLDIDEEALENTRQNLELNDCKSAVDLFLPSQFRPSKKYEFIWANILLPVLLEKREEFVFLLGTQALLLVSGILEEQKNELLTSYTQSFSLIDEKKRGDWCALLFKKR